MSVKISKSFCYLQMKFLYIYIFPRKLLEEIFNALSGLNPTFISEIVVPKCSCYNLRTGQQLVLSPTRTITLGIQSLNSRCSLNWNRLPKAIKASKTLKIFISKIKNISNFCKCNICNDFLHIT